MAWVEWRARPRGPQALAGPPALLDSAGRSGLLRGASARPPLTASGLDSGDGRSAERPVIRVLGRGATAARAHDHNAHRSGLFFAAVHLKKRPVPSDPPRTGRVCGG